MLKYVGGMAILSGVAWLVAVLLGYEPELWVTNYWLGINVLSIVAGSVMYYCGFKANRIIGRPNVYKLVGWSVFIAFGISGQQLFQAGMAQNI